MPGRGDGCLRLALWLMVVGLRASAGSQGGSSGAVDVEVLQILGLCWEALGGRPRGSDEARDVEPVIYVHDDDGVVVWCRDEGRDQVVQEGEVAAGEGKERRRGRLVRMVVLGDQGGEGCNGYLRIQGWVTLRVRKARGAKVVQKLYDMMVSTQPLLADRGVEVGSVLCSMRCCPMWYVLEGAFRGGSPS